MIQVHHGDGSWDGVPREPDWVPGGMGKPFGAFWTSTLRPDGSTAWAGFAAAVFGLPDSQFRYRTVGDPRVLELRSDGDFLSVMREAGIAPVSECFGLDGVDPGLQKSLEGILVSQEDRDRMWRWTAERYDAVRVPEGFRSRYGPLSMWDAESTAWFRPHVHLELVEVVRHAEAAVQAPRPRR